MNLAEVNEILNSLTKGETVITNVRPVANGKVQMEVAEIVSEQNLLQMLNKSDSRFGGKPRRGWITADPNDLASLLPVAAEGISEAVSSNTTVHLGIKNASIGGDPLCLRIVEGTASNVRSGVPSLWDLENIETSAKRAGANGAVMTYNDEPIVSKCQVVTISEFNELGKHATLKANTVNAGASVAATQVSENTYAAADAEQA